MFFSLKNTETSYALLAAASGLRKYLAACLLAASVTQCFAQTDFTWGNASGGDWFTAANWVEAGGPPGSSDSATIDLVTGSPYGVIVSNDVTLRTGLTLDSVDATLDFQPDTKIAFSGIAPSGSNVLELLNGTISGPGIFDIESATAPSVVIGSAADFSGNLTLNFNPINSPLSELAVLDHQLLSGRSINIFRSTSLNLKSSTFTNHGSIQTGVESPLQLAGVETYFTVADETSQGTLVNYGDLSAVPGPNNASLLFTLHNMPGGNVNLVGGDSSIDKLGNFFTDEGEAHINEGVFTSNRRLVVLGSSFTNTGTLDLNSSMAEFRVEDVNHLGGTIFANSTPLVLEGSFQMSGDAILNGTSSSSLRAGGSSQPVEVDLLAGEITGGINIELRGNGNLAVGPTSALTGDFDMFIINGGGLSTSIEFADHELKSGRSITHENGGVLTLRSSSFANYDSIEIESAFDQQAELRISEGSGYGTLINHGGLVLKRVVGQTGGQKFLNLELHNQLSGIVDLEFATGNVILGGATGLENHVNQGSFSVGGGGGRLLVINGSSFTNDGVFNLLGTATLNLSAESFTNNGTFTAHNSIVRGTRFANGMHETAIFVNNGTVDGGPLPGLTFADQILITGAGSFTGNIISSGRYEPGNSPAIVNFENLKLIQGSSLEMEIGGLTAGTEHDQIIASGIAELNGRLEIPIINGFQPAVGDVVTIISANSVTGSFKQAFSANLPDNRAIKVAINATDVTLTFKLPDAEGYDPATGGGSWLNSSIWLSGVIPDTLDNTTIINNTSTSNQTVSVNTDAFSNNLDVSSTNGTMTVQVPASRSLSAINSVDIDMNGVVDLTGGTLLSGNIDVNNGGELTGAGTLVGNVNVGSDGNGESLFKPGTTIGDNVSIEGNYRQESDGTMEIEVDGTGVGEFDTITVDGNAAFGGKLTVVINDPSAIAAGDVIEVVTAGSLTPDAIFEEIEAIGLAPGLYLAPLYDGVASANAELAASSTGGGRFSIAGFPVGDMNLSGGIDASDIALFALALIDKDEYESMFGPIAVSAGNADGLGGLDFDDIDDFSALISGGSAVQVHAAIQALLTVPEPHSITLAMFVALTCTTRRSRFAPR